MKDKFFNWFKYASVRAIRTMAQTALGIISVSTVLADINWVLVVSSTLLSGITSLLMSIAGLPEQKGE